MTPLSKCCGAKINFEMSCDCDPRAHSMGPCESGFKMPYWSCDKCRSIVTQTLDSPMGVSQWMKHGKRYGYWEYYREQIRQEILNENNNG